MKQRINHLRRSIARHRWLTIAGLLVLTAILFLGYRLLPADADDMRASTAELRGRMELCMISKGDTLVISTEHVSQQGVWVNRHWWWPSCNGRIMTLFPHPTATRLASPSVATPRQLTLIQDSLQQLLHSKQVEEKELGYYLRSHGVQDEGYTRIAQYAEVQKKKTDSLDLLLKGVNRMVSMSAKPSLAYRLRLSALWYDDEGQAHESSCGPVVCLPGQGGRPVILRSSQQSRPWDVYAVNRMPWTSKTQRIITATLSPSDSLSPRGVILAEGASEPSLRHHLPETFARDGGPVFTRKGYFLGLVSSQYIK